MGRDCTLTGRRREGGGGGGERGGGEVAEWPRHSPAANKGVIEIHLDQVRSISPKSSRVYMHAEMIKSSFTQFRRSPYFLANSSKGCPSKTHPLPLMPSVQVGFQVNILEI